MTSIVPGINPNSTSGVSSNEAATGAVSNTANLTVTAVAPTIAKAFAPATIASGGVSTLTVTISNANGAPITVGKRHRYLPGHAGHGPGARRTPATSTTCASGVVSSTAGSVTLTGGTVPASGSCTFQIDVTAATAGSYANTIAIGALTTNVGSNAAAANATLTVTPVANLAVVKSGPATIASGAPIAYSIVVSNAGPDAANAASFADTVPAAVTGVGASCGTPTGGAVCGAVNVAGNAVTSTITTLPSGGSVTFTINGTAPGVGSFTNTATITPPGGVTDPVPGNNTSSVLTAVQAPDLTIAKTHAGNFTVGVNGVYTITVSNAAGSLPTSGTITVVDTLPAGLTYVSGTGTSWACGNAGQVVTCTSNAVIGAGAVSANPITLTVSVGPTAVPSVLNIVTVSGGGEPAANNANNTGSDNTLVVLAAVNVFLTDGAHSGAPGTTLFYPHTFIAGLAGNVGFSTSNVAVPAVPGWTQLIYRDTNCNGVLDPAEGVTPLAGTVAVVPGDVVCIIVKDNIPGSAPVGRHQHHHRDRDLQRHDDLHSPGRHHRGCGGATGLALAKGVRNVTLGGASGTSNTARPNDILEYTVTYTNNSSSTVSTIVVNDSTPAFTTFQSAACGALPPGISACVVSTQPAVNGTGAIAWTLTGSLLSGGSGTVLFTVRVNP